MQNQIDTLLSLAETAGRLNVSRGTIYRLARINRIRIVKVGRLSKVRESEITRFLDDAPAFKSEAAA